MTEQRRTIPLVPTWRAAAQILTAALENGTATGQHAARTELMRMAGILDDMREQADQPAATWDVIASHPDAEPPAFGQAFSSEAEATSYAQTLRSLGYHAEDPFENEAVSLADGLAHAAAHFQDERIKQEGEQ